MTKDQLQTRIKANRDVSREDFVSVYGHCRSQDMKGEQKCAADILAKVYNKAVTHTDSGFSFEDK